MKLKKYISLTYQNNHSWFTDKWLYVIH